MADKKLINFVEYRLPKNYTLATYTAEWCNPCKRIKPHVLVVINGLSGLSGLNGLDGHEIISIVSSEIIEKEEFKKNINPFIPFFVLKNGNDIVDKIQTSDSEEFSKFIGKYLELKNDLKGLDDDF